MRAENNSMVPELCRRRLLRYADFFAELSGSFGVNLDVSGEDRQSAIVNRKLWENRQVVKGHLKEMAVLCKTMACEMVLYRPMNERLRKRLAKELEQEGIKMSNPCILTKEDGRENIVLLLSSDKKGGIAAEEITDIISVALNRHFRLSAASPLLIEHLPGSFTLEPEPRYVAITGFARATREGETVSGDNYAVVESEAGKMQVLLSDGTGSGEQAGEDSRHVLDLMEKSITAGYDVASAINLVNDSVFVMGEDLRHPTLDILNLDLHEGRAGFIKLGGAASFFKSGGLVETVTAKSLPLGINGQAVPVTSSVRLQDGDYIVLMTDGVVEAFGEGAYEETLGRMIEGMGECNPSKYADYILQAAIFAGGGRIRDDMTVGVIGIWENV